MSITSSWTNVSVNDVISLLIICLDDLSISDSGIFRSSTIWSVSPFSSVSDYFIYFGAPLLGA